MIRIFKKLTGNHLLMFSLIFIVSTVFYSYKIGFSDLWSDETYTKSMLSGSPGDFYAMFRNDLHPPLYYIGLRIFTGLAGQSATAMRAFSVVGVLATLLLGYFAGQRIFGKRGGLLFCLLLAAGRVLDDLEAGARCQVRVEGLDVSPTAEKGQAALLLPVAESDP